MDEKTDNNNTTPNNNSKEAQSPDLSQSNPKDDQPSPAPADNNPPAPAPADSSSPAPVADNPAATSSPAPEPTAEKPAEPTSSESEPGNSDSSASESASISSPEPTPAGSSSPAPAPAETPAPESVPASSPESASSAPALTTEGSSPEDATKDAATTSEPETSVSNDAKSLSPEQKKKRKAIILISVCAVILITIIIIISSIAKKYETVDSGRTKALSEIKENEVLKFKINGKEYQIGDKVENFLSDFEIDRTFSQIKADSIMITPFNRKNKSNFLGLLYCPSESPCSYEEAKLIKANFYDNSDIRIGDKVNFYSSLDGVKAAYGEPDGRYYQDKTIYVWSFGEKVGDPYLAVGFDDGWLSFGFADRIMLGVWWYDGEYEDTIIKGVEDEKENNN